MNPKYRIRIKRDWGPHGFWNSETRTCEKIGFVVTHKSGGNCIPGACWFRTISDAFTGIEAHIMVGDCMEWHTVYRNLKEKKSNE